MVRQENFCHKKASSGCEETSLGQKLISRPLQGFSGVKSCQKNKLKLMNFRVLGLQEVTGWSDKKFFVTKKLHGYELKLVFEKK